MKEFEAPSALRLNDRRNSSVHYKMKSDDNLDTVLKTMDFLTGISTI